MYSAFKNTELVNKSDFFSLKVQSNRNYLCLTDNLQKAVVCKWNVSLSSSCESLIFSEKIPQTCGLLQWFCCYKCSRPYSTLCLYIRYLGSFVSCVLFYGSFCCFNLQWWHFIFSNVCDLGASGDLDEWKCIDVFLKHSHFSCWVTCSFSICVCYNVQFCILVWLGSDE